MPYPVSFSHLTSASVPGAAWDEAWMALESWKGYLQAFPGFLRLRMSARALDGGDVRLHVAISWEHTEQLEEWLGSRWTASGLLRSLSRPAFDITEESCVDVS